MNTEKYFLPLEKSQARMNICIQCDEYIEATEMCKKCWCFLPMKTKLAPATCPKHKWLSEVLHNEV